MTIETKEGLNLLPRHNHYLDVYLTNGMNAFKAYQTCYPNASPATCAVNAYVLLKKLSIPLKVKMESLGLTLDDAKQALKRVMGSRENELAAVKAAEVYLKYVEREDKEDKTEGKEPVIFRIYPLGYEGRPQEREEKKE